MEGFYPSYWQSPSGTLVAAGDLATFYAAVPLDVVAWGVLITSAATSDVDSETWIKADLITGVSTRGDANAGQIKGGLDADFAAGSVLFTRRVNPLSSTPQDQYRPLAMNAGERIAFETFDVGDTAAGTACVFVLFRKQHVDLTSVDTRTLAQGNRNAAMVEFL